MAITRDQLEATLAVHDADALRLILHASDVDPRGAETPAALAARIADAIWWNYCTPLGYLAERTTFEDIVRHLARKLQVGDRVDPDVPVWDQVSALTAALVAELPQDGISIESLDESTRARLFPSWMPPLGWGSGATSSFATRWGTGKVLALLKTPIGRLLPLLPVVGPWVGAVRVGFSAVHLVTGPLGIAMGVLSLNSALGTNYTRLVPLVLGIGALGPQAVTEAEIVREPVISPAPVSVVSPVSAEAAPAEAVSPEADEIEAIAEEALAYAPVSDEITSEVAEPVVSEPTAETAVASVIPVSALAAASLVSAAPAAAQDDLDEEPLSEDAEPDLTDDVPDMN